MKEYLPVAFGFALIAVLLFGLYKLIALLTHFLTTLDATVTAAVVIGALAVFSSTLTLVLGRYYQAKRDREAAHRDKKIELYNRFLKGLFETLVPGNSNKGSEDSGKEEERAAFFSEVQRGLILWSGPEALKSYANWHGILTSQEDTPKAKSMIGMIDFFLSIRRDLGHSNKGIKREDIVRLMLQNADLFLRMYKLNPEVTFAEIVEAEKRLAQQSQQGGSVGT